MVSNAELRPIASASLGLTHACNLRCKYCYAGEKSGRKVSLKTARQAIDFLAQHSDDRCLVTLFGGEPLLVFELLRETVVYAHETYPKRFSFRLATNGTLVTDEVLTFFAEHEVLFSLSIDGSPEQQNLSRPTAAGDGSYEAVAANLDRILKYNPYTIAVSVINPEIAPMLADGVKHLFGLGFKYVVQTLDYSSRWQSSDILVLKNQYAELAKFYYDLLAAGAKIYYGPFDERIKTWAQKPYRLGELCDLANSQISIAPSGRIYPCVQFVGDDRDHEYAIGNVFDGFDEARRSELVSQNMQERSSCVGCDLHGRCTTYCGCVNWQTTGQLNQIPTIVCEHERMLMPIADKLANRLWKKNVALFKRKFYDKLYPVSSYLEDCKMYQEGSDAEDQTGR